MKLAKELTKKEIEEYIDEYERSWKEDKKTFENIHSELLKNRFLNKRATLRGCLLENSSKIKNCKKRRK